MLTLHPELSAQVDQLMAEGRRLMSEQKSRDLQQ
jgi:hypothetical protein